MGLLEPAGAREPGDSDRPWGRGRSSHAALERLRAPHEGAPSPASDPTSLDPPKPVCCLQCNASGSFQWPLLWIPLQVAGPEWGVGFSPRHRPPLYPHFLQSRLTQFLRPRHLASSPLPLPGSNEQGPMMVHVVWVNQRAFRLQWCPKCCFHRPPRTYHCPWCNICVEDFDHHCKWVNNCIGHRNFRFFMLLVLSLCLYSGAMLVTCLIFLVRTTHLPFSTDKAIAILVAVPAAGFLVPLFLLLLIQAVSVSAAERSYEGKCRYLQGYNPFDHGCASNWYLTICAPLGPKYMAEAVWLQRMAGSDWVPVQNVPMCPSVLSAPSLPEPGSGPQPTPSSLHNPGKGPPRSGEAAALQELQAGPVLPLLRECPRRGSAHLSPLHTR
ncbi:palmitoyltransferase ZDHHC19 isoform X1 [Hyaena hyaena]|uniref:palmitoyltransferase ZDHHC19 isoform X1 n=1 Tax=Hyaena hyaena TaxID=95912 RepID=UPI0019243F81|nr:palmitoyltransferase ZDHHC19 isoform X1 [Hyaena hyaena]